MCCDLLTWAFGHYCIDSCSTFNVRRSVPLVPDNCEKISSASIINVPWVEFASDIDYE